MDTPSVEPALAELEDVHMAEAGTSAYSQALAPPIVGNDPGVPFNVLQPLPPSVSNAPPSIPAVHETAASVPASDTTQISLPTSVSAPVAFAGVLSASYTPEIMQHYADLFQKERTRTKHEEAKSIDHDLLALFELPPGSLGAATEARASGFARTSDRPHAFRAQQQFGRSGKDQARFPSTPSIQQVVTSQGSTHDLHGIQDASQGHDVQIVPSIRVSAKTHDSSGGIASKLQPSSPSTVIPSSQYTPSIIKAPPSSPVTKSSRLSHGLPARSRLVKAGPTTSISTSAATSQKTNTGGGATQNAGESSALQERPGPLQQVGVALPLAPRLNAIAQSSGSQKTPPDSNVGSPSGLHPSLVRSPVAPRPPVAASSTSAPGPSSTIPAILKPRPTNRLVALPLCNQQQGSSSVAQSTGGTVTVAEGGASRPHRPRPKWMEDAEMEEEKEDTKREEWKKTHFSWNVPPRKDGHRSR